MFQRIRQYELVGASGEWYRPRAYGELQADGTWEGWLVFFPLAGGPASAPDRETTQTTYEALVDWAAGIRPTYLEGALDRALELEQRPPITARLASAEYEALDEAGILESFADAERIRAAAARAEADVLREERLATEKLIAAADETEAKIEATVHEEAAKEARAAAADATERRRSAEGRTSRTTSDRPKRQRRAKRTT